MTDQSKPGSVLITNYKLWEAMLIAPISPMHVGLKTEFPLGDSMAFSTRTLKEYTYLKIPVQILFCNVEFRISVCVWVCLPPVQTHEAACRAFVLC
jgi:hypothetical protein